jgi:hypothetical protein
VAQVPELVIPVRFDFSQAPVRCPWWRRHLWTAWGDRRRMEPYSGPIQFRKCIRCNREQGKGVVR